MEGNIIMLVETRGVGVSPYKREIDKIIGWIRDYTKKHYLETKEVQFSFVVPSELSGRIDFIENLKILCIAEYSLYNRTFDGTGSFGPQNNKLEYFDENVLKNMTISTKFYFDGNGNIKNLTMTDTLYHELNHAYECYCSTVKNGNFRVFNSTADVAKGVNSANDIGFIIYRLFSKTETNAAVASVFGDLQDMDSDRKNFRNDLLYCKAYRIYDIIKSHYEEIVDDLTYEETVSVILHLSSNGINLNYRNVNIDSVKRALKHEIENRLNVFIKKIGKTASFWYDTKEESEKDDGTIPTTVE